MKRYLCSFLAAVCCVTLWAQAPREDNRQAPQKQEERQKQSQEERQKQFEEMKLKQIAYFTERIGLTAEEAESFWPIVNDIRDRRWRINHDIRRCFRQGKDNKEVDYAKTLERLMDLRKQEADLEKECYDKLKKILSPEKLYKYYKAEEDFSFELLRSFEQDKKQPQPQPQK